MPVGWPGSDDDNDIYDDDNNADNKDENTSPESDCTDWGSCAISRCLGSNEQIIASNHQTHTKYSWCLWSNLWSSLMQTLHLQ